MKAAARSTKAEMVADPQATSGESKGLRRRASCLVSLPIVSWCPGGIVLSSLPPAPEYLLLTSFFFTVKSSLPLNLESNFRTRHWSGSTRQGRQLMRRGGTKARIRDRMERYHADSNRVNLNLDEKKT